MTGMALWFTDPLAREVEPTKIPGVTEQDASYFGVLLWCGSSLATLGNTEIPNVRTAVVLWSSSSRSAVLDTTGELTVYVNELILQSTVLFVCRVVWKDITGVGMPRDKPAGEDANL